MYGIFFDHNEHIIITDFNTKIKGQDNISWYLNKHLIEIYISEEKSFLIFLSLLIIFYYLVTYLHNSRNDMNIAERESTESDISAASAHSFTNTRWIICSSWIRML